MRKYIILLILIISSSLVLGQTTYDDYIQAITGQPSDRHLQFERPDNYRDNGWSFCTLRFTRKLGMASTSGSGWNTDWPKAQINIMRRMYALTTVNVDMINEDDPRHWVVDAQLDTDSLSTCPFIFTSDYGVLEWQSPAEIQRVREYLLKGGLLWVDDAWGYAEWDNWVKQIRQVLPEEHYQIRDIPENHPILNQPYKLDVIQMPNIGVWNPSSQKTSELGEESETPRLLGISDEYGRLMVIMSHNTDFADPWEHDHTSPYFEEFGAPGYGIGINIILYSMTY